MGGRGFLGGGLLKPLGYNRQSRPSLSVRDVARSGPAVDDAPVIEAVFLQREAEAEKSAAGSKRVLLRTSSWSPSRYRARTGSFPARGTNPSRHLVGPHEAHAERGTS